MTDWDAADRGYDEYQDHLDRLQWERDRWAATDGAPTPARVDGPRCTACKHGRCDMCRDSRHCFCTHTGARSVELPRPVLDGSGVPVPSGAGPRTFAEAAAVSHPDRGGLKAGAR